MQTIQVKDFRPGMDAYLWEETGNGSLRKVDYIRWPETDPWAVTGNCSWCVCGCDTLYVFDYPGERQMVEGELRRRLQLRLGRCA